MGFSCNASSKAITVYRDTGKRANIPSPVARCRRADCCPPSQMEEAELSLGPRALLIGLTVRQQHTLIGGMAEQQAVVLCCGLLLLLQAAGPKWIDIVRRARLVSPLDRE